MKRSKAQHDRIKLELVFSRRQLKAGVAGGLILLFCGLVSSETLTMVASFPSPIGIYNKLVATGQTILARDGGKVGIGTTTPAATLDVQGATNVNGTITASGDVSVGGKFQMAALASDPAGSAAGQMYFNTNDNTLHVNAPGANGSGPYWHQLYANPVTQGYTNQAAIAPGSTETVYCPNGASATGGGCDILDSAGNMTDISPGPSHPLHSCWSDQTTGWQCVAPAGLPSGYIVKATAVCSTTSGNPTSTGAKFCFAVPAGNLMQ